MKPAFATAIMAAVLAVFGLPLSGTAQAQVALRAPDIAEIGDLGMLEMSREQFRKQFKGRMFSDRLRYQGPASAPLFASDGRPGRHLSFYLDGYSTVFCLPGTRLGEDLAALPDSGTDLRVTGLVEDYSSGQALKVLLSDCELNALS